MNAISQTKKAVLALVLFAFSGYIIYSSFFSSPSSIDTNTSIAGEVATTSSEGQDVLNLASQLDTISIDSSLFSSPLFTNLKDFTPSLFPENFGRNNPFAKIGGESSFVSSDTSLPAPTQPSGKKSSTTAR